MMISLANTNPIVAVIRCIYGITTDTKSYFDVLLESMKKSQNKTISATGKVIEAAMHGFGLGFATPIVLITLGQLILGHPFVAVGVVLTAPVNPIAITCAAIGAIYYGWTALTEEERNAIVDRVCKGLEVGAELIKAIVNFTISKSKEWLSAESLLEFKRFISDAARSFGKSLSDITHSIKDRASEAYDYVAEKVKPSNPDDDRPLPRLPI